MATFRQGPSPVCSKGELGKVKAKRSSSSIHHVGRSKVKLCRGSQVVSRLSRESEDKCVSVPKTGGVFRALAGSRNSSKRERGGQGFLFSALYSSKGQGQTSSNHRPFFAKQRNKEKRSKDAGPQINSQVSKIRDVGSETRFKRCLLSRSTPSFGMEVLQVLPKEKRIPSKEFFLQKDALWPNYSSLGVHKDSVSFAKGSKASGYSGVCLPGRLPDPSILQGRGLEGYRSGHKLVAGSRVQDKLGQIFCRTSQNSRISGCNNKSGGSDLLSSRRKGSENPSYLSQVSEGKEDFKEILGSNGRIPYLCSKPSQMGKTPFETSTNLDEFQYFSPSERCLDPGRRVFQGSLSSLVQREFSSNSYFLCESGSIEGGDDRCIRGGLVRSHTSQNLEGRMARGMEESFHELEGIEGNSSIPSLIQRRVGGSESESPIRQHDSSCLPKETRLFAGPRTASFDRGDLHAARGSKYFYNPNALEGKAQCSGRSGVQEGSYFNRVVSGRSLVPVVLQPSRDPSGGLVCNQVQSETSEICVPVPRFRGRGLGCFRESNRLEPLEVYLPLSALDDHGQGSWLDRILQRGRIFDSPFLADSTLVPAFETEMSKKHPITKRRTFVPEVFRQGILPQGKILFKPSRLEVIKEAVMAEGLTEYSAKILGRCHRSSTIRQYQCVWKKFLNFLEKEKI